MTPHQVISLLTQDQTADLLAACLQYLPLDRVEAAMREGLEEWERRQLAFQLSIEFDRDDSGSRSS